MEDYDKVEFIDAINELVGSYANQKFSDENVKSYFRKLSKYSIETVLAVLHRAPTEYQDRMPTAGQLVQMCKAVSSDAVRETKEYLKRTFGEDYYEKDYAEGVRVGVNRPVREVIADDVDRGWRDVSALERYDFGNEFGDPPAKEKVPQTPRCKALEEAWAREAKGEFLEKDENRRRMNLLMKAFSEDHKELSKKKIIDRMSREV